MCGASFERRQRDLWADMLDEHAKYMPSILRELLVEVEQTHSASCLRDLRNLIRGKMQGMQFVRVESVVERYTALCDCRTARNGTRRAG